MHTNVAFLEFPSHISGLRIAPEEPQIPIRPFLTFLHQGTHLAARVLQGVPRQAWV